MKQGTFQIASVLEHTTSSYPITGHLGTWQELFFPSDIGLDGGQVTWSFLHFTTNGKSRRSHRNRGTNYPADTCHLVLVPHSRILFWAGFKFLHKQVIWEIIPGKTNKEVRE